MSRNKILNHAEHNHALPQPPTHNKRSGLSVCESVMNYHNRDGCCFTRLSSPTRHDPLFLAKQQFSLVWKNLKPQNSLSEKNWILTELEP
jgi:hypothetical protein